MSAPSTPQWNPREELRATLAQTGDDGFERVFLNGKEVDGLASVPTTAPYTMHVVAYSMAHVFYRYYYRWRVNSHPTITADPFEGDPHYDMDIDPEYTPSEMV